MPLNENQPSLSFDRSFCTISTFSFCLNTLRHWNNFSQLIYEARNNCRLNGIRTSSRRRLLPANSDKLMRLCLNSNSYERYKYDEVYAQRLRSANRMRYDARASAPTVDSAEQLENAFKLYFLILHTLLSVDFKT